MCEQIAEASAAAPKGKAQAMRGPGARSAASTTGAMARSRRGRGRRMPTEGGEREPPTGRGGPREVAAPTQGRRRGHRRSDADRRRPAADAGGGVRPRKAGAGRPTEMPAVDRQRGGRQGRLADGDDEGWGVETPAEGVDGRTATGRRQRGMPAGGSRRGDLDGRIPTGGRRRTDADERTPVGGRKRGDIDGRIPTEGRRRTDAGEET